MSQQYNMFFINHAKTYLARRNPTPKELYAIFYKKIQAEQLSEYKVLKKALDIIEQEVRRINVVTEDEGERATILAKTEILMKIDREIREAHAKPGHEFLKALDTIFTYPITYI